MASRDPQRPNVLFILSDDQGAWALGAAGNDEIQTPRLDRLAAEGTRADRFFCTSPICSPARASLLTGQMPSQHGVLDFLTTRHVGRDGVDFLRGRRLVTEILAEDGYRCGLSGKWHLGANDVARPGFVHWFAHQSGAGPYFRPPLVQDGELVVGDRYVTDLITEDAIDFITEQADGDEPFWASVHYTAPHFPWLDNHPVEYTSRYEDCPFQSAPQEPDHPNLRRNADGRAVSLRTESDTRSALIGYYAAVTAMDTAVGRLVDTLEQLGLTGSTLVVFLSDNGFNCGHHGIWGKGNGTYPQNMYDTSVLVPAIFRQPGRVVPQTTSALLSGYDVAPTLLDWVGLEADALGHVPGRPFSGLLRGEPEGAESPVVVFDEYGPTRMIRTVDWKYVHRHPDGPHELYCLAEDPGERVDLIDEPAHADRVAAMRAELLDWFQTYREPEHDAVQHEVSGWGQRAPITESPFVPAHTPVAWPPAPR